MPAPTADSRPDWRTRTGLHIDQTVTPHQPKVVTTTADRVPGVAIGPTWRGDHEAVGYRNINGQWLAVATKYFSDSAGSVEFDF